MPGSTGEDQLSNRVLLGAAMVMVAVVAGCSSDGGTGSGGGTGQKGAITAPDTPEGTLTELVHRIADGNAARACELFVPGGQATFAQEFKAQDCVTAMQIVIGKVTDPKQFGAATLKPSGKYPGVRIEGDSADFGGACTGPVLFVRLQAPASITDVATTAHVVYGRIYVAGVTDQTGGNDPNPNVVVQVGVGAGADPTTWTWTLAVPNPSRARARRRLIGLRVASSGDQLSTLRRRFASCPGPTCRA